MTSVIQKLAENPSPENLAAMQDIARIQRARPWMSELWTVVLAAPLVLAFIPPLTATVASGYQALSHVPDWVRWAIGGSVSLAFCIRVGTVASATIVGARKIAPPSNNPTIKET